MIGYLGGNYCENSEIKIPITDLAFTRGWSVFDYFRTYNFKLGLLDLHLGRLRNSLKEAGIKLDFEKKDIEKILSKLILLNKIKSDVAFRVIVTAGDSENSFFPTKKSRLIILVEKIHPIEDIVYIRGYFAKLVDVQRLMPRAKTINYLPGLKLLSEAKKQGFDDVIYTSANRVLEGVTNNIFVVKNGRLLTPKENVLNGITRQLILKIAKNSKIPTFEKNISIYQLLESNEVFSTSTIRQVLPITKINGKRIGNGVPGKLTKKIDLLFKKYITDLT